MWTTSKISKGDTSFSEVERICYVALTSVVNEISALHEVDIAVVDLV